MLVHSGGYTYGVIKGTETWVSLRAARVAVRRVVGEGIGAADAGVAGQREVGAAIARLIDA